jgi:hypothetical protein
MLPSRAASLNSDLVARQPLAAGGAHRTKRTPSKRSSPALVAHPQIAVSPLREGMRRAADEPSCFPTRTAVLRDPPGPIERLRRGCLHQAEESGG